MESDCFRHAIYWCSNVSKDVWNPPRNSFSVCYKCLLNQGTGNERMVRIFVSGSYAQNVNCKQDIHKQELILQVWTVCIDFNEEFLFYFIFRYQQNLKTHSIRVMAVVEKVMNRLYDEKGAAKVSKYIQDRFPTV